MGFWDWYNEEKAKAEAEASLVLSKLGNPAASTSSNGRGFSSGGYTKATEAGAGSGQTMANGSSDAKVVDMTPSSKLAGFIANWEQFEPKPYRPTANDSWTIAMDMSFNLAKKLAASMNRQLGH